MTLKADGACKVAIDLDTHLFSIIIQSLVYSLNSGQTQVTIVNGKRKAFHIHP